MPTNALVSTWMAIALAAAGAPTTGPLPNEALALRAETLLVGVDAKALFASPLYGQITRGESTGFDVMAARAQGESMRKEMQEGLAKGLKEAEDKTGVRLDRDVDRVVMAVDGLDEKEPLITVLAVGRFDRARVTAAATATYKADGGTSRTKDVADVSVVFFEKAGKTDLALALPDDHTVVFGSPVQVERTVVDRQKGVNALTNPTLLRLVQGLKPDAGYWFVAGETLVDKMKEKSAGGGAPPPFPLPRSLSLTGGFDGAIEVTAQMADDAAAKSATDMIVSSLAGMTQALRQGQTKETTAMLSLVSGINVKQEGKAVRFTSPGSASGGGAFTMISAIAIPGLLRARISANEAAAIGDTRTVLSAQAAYSAATQGAYGEMRCLAEPKTCRPSYAGPFFLDQGLASLADKSGYKRAFFPGRATKPGSRALTSFAYTATPIELGRTGVRSFCGDSTGVICFDAGGAPFQPAGGSCPKECTPLK